MIHTAYTRYWVRFCLLNLFFVGVLGVLMRYKIGFSLPFIEQKNLQHAHSHFAFSGWVGLLLMVLMVHVLRTQVPTLNMRPYQRIFWSYLACAYGMLFTFIWQGYGLFSITCSTLSLVLVFWFTLRYWADVRLLPSARLSSPWFRAALLFQLLSTLGTLYLSYMMATKHLEQRPYLASVYWYLHFQYNGWFFFACAGLFWEYLQDKGIVLPSAKTIFWLFAASCLPAYGLSILWWPLDWPLYIVVAISAIAQMVAWVWWLRSLWAHGDTFFSTSFSWVPKVLLLCVGTALTLKLGLQLGSTIPAVSKLAFGFRPIVIAYLHLVLLALITVFLLTYLYLRGLMDTGATSTAGLLIFVFGIFLNELVLAIQGVASFSYTVVPFTNELLFGISLLMLGGIGLLQGRFGKTTQMAVNLNG